MTDRVTDKEMRILLDRYRARKAVRLIGTLHLMRALGRRGLLQHVTRQTIFMDERDIRAAGIKIRPRRLDRVQIQTTAGAWSQVHYFDRSDIYKGLHHTLCGKDFRLANGRSLRIGKETDGRVCRRCAWHLDD